MIDKTQTNMKTALQLYLSCLFLTLLNPSHALSRYGEQLCQTDDYDCLKVKQGDTWESLFPDDEERDIVRRINRINLSLKTGMKLAVPHNLGHTTLYDHAPFPRHIDSIGEKTVYISQQKLAWGAYDRNGELLWWGPISSGADRCSGQNGHCHTPGGAFRMIRKQDIDCVSTAFPKRSDGFHGGAPMPYCMHFFRGYAIHGAPVVPGYRASHGCVRLFIEDARWLNQEFIELPGGGQRGTKVIIEPLKGWEV